MHRLGILVMTAILVACVGCAGRVAPEVSPDFRAHGASEAVLIYPVELVKPDRVYHDPHEAARFGETLRRGGFNSLRLSPQHADLHATPAMDSAQLLRAAKDAIARQVRENRPDARFGLFAGYVLDKNETPIALLAVATNTDGEPALAIIVDQTDPRFAEHPPKNMVECAELLGRVVTEEAGIAPQDGGRG